MCFYSGKLLLGQLFNLDQGCGHFKWYVHNLSAHSTSHRLVISQTSLLLVSCFCSYCA